MALEARFPSRAPRQKSATFLGRRDFLGPTILQKCHFAVNIRQERDEDRSLIATVDATSRGHHPRMIAPQIAEQSRKINPACICSAAAPQTPKQLESKPGEHPQPTSQLQWRREQSTATTKSGLEERNIATARSRYRTKDTRIQAEAVLITCQELRMLL